MKFVKYSSSDWMSSALGLVDLTNKPKSSSKVVVKCSKCDYSKSVVLIEHARAVTKQSIYTDTYLCNRCLNLVPEYIEKLSQSKAAGLAKLSVGASERSAALWKDPAYRAKRSVKMSDDTKKKLSDAIKKKFDEDQEYRDKISAARKKYWEDSEYRVARTISFDDFVSRAIDVHGQKYEYARSDYFNYSSKVAITCRVHGQFIQRASHHLSYGNGCPSCAFESKSSSQERSIKDWVSSLGFATIGNDRDIIKGLELDIVVPSVKLAIEFHGIYWHSYSQPELPWQKNLCAIKCDLAGEAGYSLLQFYDSEWNQSQDIVKSIILHKLGLSTRVHARKCSLSVISEDQACLFFNSNHLQGHRPSSFYVGLLDSDGVAAAMAVSRHKNGHELMRYANRIGCVVSGGFSRLLKYSIDRLGVRHLLSYADRRYSPCANTYVSNGFKYCGVTKPNYYYFKNGITYSRQSFQKNKLKSVLEVFDDKLSESQNMFNNKYRRYWDAGHHRLIFNV